MLSAATPAPAVVRRASMPGRSLKRLCDSLGWTVEAVSGDTGTGFRVGFGLT